MSEVLASGKCHPTWLGTQALSQPDFMILVFAFALLSVHENFLLTAGESMLDCMDLPERP